MKIPDNFTHILPLAKRCKALEIEFSGKTYQVHIQEPDAGEKAWSFVQLDTRGNIKDCFCSCENGESEDPCVHIAAAFLRIYKDEASPLHLRFERSLWNVLGALYAKAVGDDVSVLKKKEYGSYEYCSFGGKLIFSIAGMNKHAREKIEELIHQRKRETEETSIKFSNLSPEEILLWREGRPSAQLKYELSFWNDFAKWLMLLEEEEVPYSIGFEYDNNKWPCFLTFQSREVHMGFYLSKANLPLVIPSLSTVNSPLKVYGGTQTSFRKIAYDKKTGILKIEPAGHSFAGDFLSRGIAIEGWRLIEGMGFYPSDQKLLSEKQNLEGPAISKILNEHLNLLKTNLEGAFIHEEPAPVSYTVAFDKSWDLLITAYLFNPGDLTQGDSRWFGDWAYVDDDGFYHLENLRFPQVETKIPSESISGFITQNRTWLNLQEGFQTHIVGIETQLSYEVSSHNKLTFFRAITSDSVTEGIKDFSPWMYVPGQGFYSKTSSQTGISIKPGLSIHADQIPLFIRTNADELRLIPRFFSDTCPIASSSLHIKINEQGCIAIQPVDVIHENFAEKTIRFFDDFIYVPGEGFSELPPASRYPVEYRQEVVIDSQKEEAFLLCELEALKPFVSFIDPKLSKPPSLQLELQGIEKVDHQYDLKFHYVSDFGSVPITSCWKGMNQRKHFLFTDAGLIDLREKKCNWIQWLNKNQVDLKGQSIHLSNWELMRLKAFEDFTIAESEKSEIQHTLQDLFECRIYEEPDLTDLNSKLRPYQEIGIRWLWFLYQEGLSGLLCDDMGLGKTHQTMALLAAVFSEKSKASNKRFLIICPTSVLYHWQEKLAQFLPKARVFTFYGIKRSLEEFENGYDVFLTSYGIWRQDAEILSEISFEIAVFDEIQIAKNHNSRIYAALQSAKAVMRLGLTGTPIENRLRELKSLFDLMLPGYMPGETEYREMFVKPIEKESDKDQKQLLTRLIKPFVLRRKKTDVLTDLPEKIEEVAHCDLSEDQRLLYNDLVLKAKNRIFNELDDRSKPIPYMHVFALLSGLKQICDHPAVFLKTPSLYKETKSGKWDLFVELLDEARASKQKVVVFSQYLYMLDIIESYLNEQGIGFASIRGSTQNRGEQLQLFNKDPSCGVFVASLQASGLGIDLTAASVVIHYDRAWNAARENQATDRVHRIGQTRGVQVFKLVNKNTFEERIDELILQKGKLMEDVIGVDEQDVIKQFSREEIIQLLKLVN